MDLFPSYLMVRMTWPFGHDEADNPTELTGLPFQANVVELAGVPQRHEIAVKHFRVILVALFRIDEGTHSVLRNTARAAELNLLDVIFGRRSGLGLLRRCSGRRLSGRCCGLL